MMRWVKRPTGKRDGGWMLGLAMWPKAHCQFR